MGLFIRLGEFIQDQHSIGSFEAVISKLESPGHPTNEHQDLTNMKAVYDGFFFWEDEDD